MPDVIDNCSYREAQAKLTAMGFLVGDPKYITGEKDWVYGVECNGKSLAAGDRVSIEDKIVLQIGSGQRDANDSVVVTDAVYVNMPERGDVNGGEVDAGRRKAFRIMSFVLLIILCVFSLLFLFGKIFWLIEFFYSPHRRLDYACCGLLLVECLLESLKLVLLSYASLPPCLKESESIAHELDKGGCYAYEADAWRLVAYG